MTVRGGVIRSESGDDDALALEFEPAPWTQIPLELINDETLSPPARFLYVKLRSYENQRGAGAYPRQRTLADCLGCSISSVRRYIRELTDTGWLRVREQRRADGSRRANLYVVAAAPRRAKRAEGVGVSAGGDMRSPVNTCADQANGDNSSVPHESPAERECVDLHERTIDAGRNMCSPVNGGPSTGERGSLHQWRGIELEPRELEPPPTTTPRPTGSDGRRLVAVDLAGRDGTGQTPSGLASAAGIALPVPPGSDQPSAPQLRDGAASALAEAVRAALPQGLAQQVASGPLLRACRQLAATGVGAADLGTLTTARPWAGAGPGAVIAWLRADAASELAAGARAAAGKSERDQARDFRTWSATQPDCPHGQPGGNLPRPVLGTPTCAACRAGPAAAVG